MTTIFRHMGKYWLNDSTTSQKTWIFIWGYFCEEYFFLLLLEISNKTSVFFSFRESAIFVVSQAFFQVGENQLWLWGESSPLCFVQYQYYNVWISQNTTIFKYGIWSSFYYQLSRSPPLSTPYKLYSSLNKFKRNVNLMMANIEAETCSW